MSQQKGCCGLTTLEATLAFLFIIMTGVAIGLISVMMMDSNNQSGEPEATPPPLEPPPPPPLENPFVIGVGRADCTGPPADIPLMGYASLDQTAGGIHTRLYSRAFIVDDGKKRVVFVTVDVGMVSQRLRLEVLKELKNRFGDRYSQDNVVLSGTHTHSGLAGYFQYTLFMISSKGYIKPSIQALVGGIVKSIDLAQRNMRPGRIYMNRGELEDSSLNRSPHSYLNNPQEERNKYKFNTDKQVVVLKFTDLNGVGMGMLSWFAVHAVSMQMTNRMVSGDNMGYASLIMEQEKNIGSLPGEGEFVAGFSSSNLGDVSPNIRGPICVNTGEACDYLNSSCPIGGTKMCKSFGPGGDDMFESTRIIGENIYKKAKDLYDKAVQEVKGVVHAAHQWVNMTNVTVQLNATHTARTCKPALGHSFAAGTTDGGGELNFTQGAVEGDPFWDGIRDDLLGVPSNETQECHHPKPILFNTGEMNRPVPWHPQVVDVQMMTVGPLAVVAVPGEMTTMSGRRIRDAVREELQSQGSFKDVEVVIAGLSNTYTHYITTYEEYQNKEHTLPRGPEPPFFKDSQLISLLPAVRVDRKPANTSFGDVLMQAAPLYTVGGVASVTFVAGNPRNSGDMRDKTFITVEKFHNGTSSWEVVHTDASWETRFYWLKSDRQSNTTVEWHIPLSAQTGSYRIRHFGHYKQMKGLKPVITAYQGTSDVFRVSRRPLWF